jgi:bifunctional UDP-N-acetylglucosamine pyrophosphorylase/glucosamine-1-phosphate N-acetyltransferase
MKLKNVLILAGGNSTRFWPLSHKSLFSYLGKTLIERQIELYSQFAESITIVSNAQTFDRIREISQKWNCNVVIQHDDGQSAAILSAREYISDETLIVNANDIYKSSLVEKVIEKVQNQQCDGIFVAKKVDEYIPGGYLVMNGATVTAIIEKPGPDNMPSPYWKFVVDYFSHVEEFIEILQRTSSDRDDVYEVALTEYLKAGKRFELLEYPDQSATVKYPWHVLDVQEFFLSSLESHVADSASVHPSTIIQGNVYIDEGAKVHEYSKIIGPAYIGKNTVVGNYSMISGSVIGEDCVIGGYSEVTRSFIGPMVWTHRAYIGDSIVEGPGNFAAGSVTANLRFDKKSILTTIKGEKTDSQRTKLGLIAGRNVEIGINASTMPGVKLAPGTKVMPGSVLFKDNE